MKQTTTVIFTALRIESRAVERALKGAGRPVQIHTIGIGAKRIPLVLPKDLGAIIMAGLAGALDPDLKIGDVVVDDPRAIVPKKLSLRRGRIFTAERIVATAGEKAELFAETGAAAVDMEQADVQKLASPVWVSSECGRSAMRRMRW